MRVSPVLVGTTLLAMLLAGCSGSGEATADEEEKVAAQTGISDVPEWTPGMYWTYESPGGTASYVVTEASGGEYLVEVNDKGSAYYEARYDSAFQGPIRQSDLAGSEDGRRVVMFDWPLEPNKEWSTTWDGEPLNMRANPMGPGQYHVMGHRDADDQMVVEYHYNAGYKWFEYVVFYNETSGDESFRLDLQDNGDDFSGTIYRYTIGETMAFVADAQSSGIEDATIGAEWNELGLTFLAACGGDAAGQIAIGMNDPEAREGNPFPMAPFFNEPQYGLFHDCQAGDTMSDELVVTNPGGDWEVGLLAGSPNGAAHIFVEPRSLETLAL